MLLRKSRTRSKRRFAIRGVPRERSAISRAASSLIHYQRHFALRLTISARCRNTHMLHVPNGHQRCRNFAVVAPINVNGGNGNAPDALLALSDHDIHEEIFSAEYSILSNTWQRELSIKVYPRLLEAPLSPGRSIAGPLMSS